VHSSISRDQKGQYGGTNRGPNGEGESGHVRRLSCNWVQGEKKQVPRRDLKGRRGAVSDKGQVRTRHIPLQQRQVGLLKRGLEKGKKDGQASGFSRNL